jgi:hypothetical protein
MLKIPDPGFTEPYLCADAMAGQLASGGQAQRSRLARAAQHHRQRQLVRIRHRQSVQGIFTHSLTDSIERIQIHNFSPFSCIKLQVAKNLGAGF